MSLTSVHTFGFISILAQRSSSELGEPVEAPSFSSESIQLSGHFLGAAFGRAGQIDSSECVQRGLGHKRGIARKRQELKALPDTHGHLSRAETMLSRRLAGSFCR